MLTGYRFRGQKEKIKSLMTNLQKLEIKVAKMKMKKLREKFDCEDRVKFRLKIYVCIVIRMYK